MLEFNVLAAGRRRRADSIGLPDMQPDRTALLTALFRQRILVLDGAMGTMIQGYRLGEAEYRGDCLVDHPHDVKGDNDLLALTRPRA